ncbi:hypothetical protein ACILDT_09460 [Capnocytophaga canis]|uniref:Uncharacterized protein n=1 Tax=Capnocytophaga canis TaxID=1848903 RepID=A0A0B7ILL2_9FLAO|nr:hypothetical protein [Capnocytophaga canis]CEN52730.1 hypothetical protein CCAND93_290004 [Capnocytophaga canis]
MGKEVSIISFSIDLSKIPEEKIVDKNDKGEPFKSGGKYVNLTLFVNQEKDAYDHDVAISLQKKKDSEEATIYVGNGKIIK